MKAPSAVIIDYDAGNLRSVARACTEVGLAAEISPDADKLRHAERIIFPGVGAAGAAMASMRSRGLDEALKDAINSGVPVLGICLGLQISLDHSEENDTPTLGLIPGQVRRFRVPAPEYKVPHMGWNEVVVSQPHPVLAGIEAGDEFYFVHGYYPAPDSDEYVYARTDYHQPFACVVGRDNYIATQFHTEKSGRVGLRLLKNFAEWDGQC